MAYQEVGFSGEQFVLEKGVYRNCYDWGAGNSALASLQPILQVSARRREWGPPEDWGLDSEMRPLQRSGSGRTQSRARGGGASGRGGANTDRSSRGVTVRFRNIQTNHKN